MLKAAQTEEQKMSLFPSELLGIASNHFPFTSITAAESSTSSVTLGPRPLPPSE